MNEFQGPSNGRWALITGASAGIGKVITAMMGVSPKSFKSWLGKRSR